MERWFEEVETNAMPGVVCYLVGTKLDKVNQRTVKYEEGEELARRFGCGEDGLGGFCEVSSKTKENVRKPFVEIVDAISKKPELLNSGRGRTGTVNVGNDSAMGTGCSC